MDDQTTYTRLRENLEDIVVQVRSKDVPLEKCLDLFDEALRIGGRCVEMIDRTDFSAVELEAMTSADDSEIAETPESSAFDEGVGIAYEDLEEQAAYDEDDMAFDITEELDT